MSFQLRNLWLEMHMYRIYAALDKELTNCCSIIFFFLRYCHTLAWSALCLLMDIPPRLTLRTNLSESNPSNSLAGSCGINLLYLCISRVLVSAFRRLGLWQCNIRCSRGGIGGKQLKSMADLTRRQEREKTSPRWYGKDHRLDLQSHYEVESEKSK